MACGVMLSASPASAQTEPEPANEPPTETLPEPLPPPEESAPTYTPTPPPPPREPPPPEYPYVEPPATVPVHAPRFSLWAGARVGFQAFGNSFFRNEYGRSETSGNFIKSGIGTELNVGVRIERRYIPYVFYDRYWSFGAGRRFEGADASAYGQLFGVGFRYLFGNPDFIAGFTDISFGRRSVHVSSGGQSFSMNTLEFFRLALGAEIRLKTSFTISPQVSISSGSMTGTSGTVTYARQTDGLTQPRFRDGQSIEDATAYVIIGFGLGGHFDLFGK